MALLPVVATVVVLSAAAQSPPAAPAPDRAEPRSIELTSPDAAESWALSVQPLAPQDGQPASHAFLFLGILKGCTTPRTFPIVFVTDGGQTISKQGALLSRQPDGGGCVDALATVFPEGSADTLASAARVTVRLPAATFELTGPQLEYMRRGLARRREAEPVAAGVDSAVLRAKETPLPVDPAARAAAEEASTLNERAVALVGAGRLKDARKAAEGAVAAAERAYGAEHAEVGSRLVNLGMIERKLGDNDAALADYQRAIRLLEPNGPSHGLGVVLDNMGRILQERKDYDGGIAATSRAVDVLSAVLGPEHEHVAYATNNLALIFDAKGDHTRAADLCDRAVALLVKALGPDDPRLRPFLDDQKALRRRAGRH